MFKWETNAKVALHAHLPRVIVGSRHDVLENGADCRGLQRVLPGRLGPSKFPHLAEVLAKFFDHLCSTLNDLCKKQYRTALKI